MDKIPPMTPEMQNLFRQAEEAMEKLAREEVIVTDGFARAFIDATGLRPDQAQMMVEQKSIVDTTTGSHSIMRRIWFERRQ